MTVVIECKQVTKEYGDESNRFIALRGVDLTIHAGELFMLVGPSGCGKTTLISIIAGILDPTHGVCQVLSHNIKELSSNEKTLFRAQNIGFVFQSFNLLPSLTAVENVAIPLIINKVPWAKALKKATDLLAHVGIKERMHALPSQLSGGQQQRVAIARALITEPKIIVCDEPTSALDHHTGEKVIQLMQSMSKQYGITLVIVTHDNRIFEYADRIGKMDDGVISSIEVNTTAT
jgi:putative ABC transport system ATP-binding protein